jgi:putative endonuclease
LPCTVYILRSENSGHYYRGQTDNLERRVSQHNDSLYNGSKYAKRNKALWVCVYKEEFINRSEAMKREKELKMKKSRTYIENLLSRQSPASVRYEPPCPAGVREYLPGSH